jgi:hypothetical protein
MQQMLDSYLRRAVECSRILGIVETRARGIIYRDRIVPDAHARAPACDGTAIFRARRVAPAPAAPWPSVDVSCFVGHGPINLHKYEQDPRHAPARSARLPA